MTSSVIYHSTDARKNEIYLLITFAVYAEISYWKADLLRNDDFPHLGLFGLQWRAIIFLHYQLTSYIFSALQHNANHCNWIFIQI